MRNRYQRKRKISVCFMSKTGFSITTQFPIPVNRKSRVIIFDIYFLFEIGKLHSGCTLCYCLLKITPSSHANSTIFSACFLYQIYISKNHWYFLFHRVKCIAIEILNTALTLGKIFVCFLI